MAGDRGEGVGAGTGAGTGTEAGASQTLEQRVAELFRAIGGA